MVQLPILMRTISIARHSESCRGLALRFSCVLLVQFFELLFLGPFLRDILDAFYVGWPVATKSFFVQRLNEIGQRLFPWLLFVVVFAPEPLRVHA